MMTIEENPLVKNVKQFKESGICAICGYAGPNTRDEMMGTVLVITHADYAARFKGISRCQVADYIEVEEKMLAEESKAVEGEVAKEQPIAAENNFNGFEQGAEDGYWTGRMDNAEPVADHSLETVEPAPAEPEPGGMEIVSMSSAGERPSGNIPMPPEARRERSTIQGTISEGPVREQTPDEFYDEMDELLKGEISEYLASVKKEYHVLIFGLTDVFNRHVNFSLDKMGTTITDKKAQQWLLNIKNAIKELGLLAKKLPEKEPVKMYIIFRETRKGVTRSGLVYMDKNIDAVAEIVDARMLKQLRCHYDGM